MSSLFRRSSSPFSVGFVYGCLFTMKTENAQTTRLSEKMCVIGYFHSTDSHNYAELMRHVVFFFSKAAHFIVFAKVEQEERESFSFSCEELSDCSILQNPSILSKQTLTQIDSFLSR